MEAIQRLSDAGIKVGGYILIQVRKSLFLSSQVKFVTNESARTRASLHAKLSRLGFKICIEDILTPALAMMVLIKEQQLRPHLLVNKNVMEDFVGVESSNPNCVVLGDAVEEFSYSNLNRAFQVEHQENMKSVFQIVFRF